MRPAHVTAAKLSGPAGRRSTVAPAPPRELRPLSRLQRPPSQHRPLQPCGHASVSSPCDHWPPRPPLTPRCPSLRLARVRRGAPWRRWAGPLRAGAGAGGRSRGSGRAGPCARRPGSALPGPGPRPSETPGARATRCRRALSCGRSRPGWAGLEGSHGPGLAACTAPAAALSPAPGSRPGPAPRQDATSALPPAAWPKM